MEKLFLTFRIKVLLKEVRHIEREFQFISHQTVNMSQFNSSSRLLMRSLYCLSWCLHGLTRRVLPSYTIRYNSLCSHITCDGSLIRQ